MNRNDPGSAHHLLIAKREAVGPSRTQYHSSSWSCTCRPTCAPGSRGRLDHAECAAGLLAGELDPELMPLVGPAQMLAAARRQGQCLLLLGID